MAKRQSRAERYAETIQKISDGKGALEELRDELQNWLDNMPENLQDSEKANALQEAIDNLENSINSLEEVEGTEVEFPGMMG